MLKGKVKKITGNIILIGFFSYIAFSGGSGIISRLKYPRLKDESKIEEILRREVKKFNLEGEKIALKIADYSRSPLFPMVVYKFGDGSYLMELKKGAITEGTIKHEAYHIYKRDEGGLLSPKFWLIEEPRAILYEVYNIRL